jgi:Trypsin-co-occurring domain 1
MARIVEFKTETGASILVAVEEIQRGMIPVAAPGKVAVAAQQTFEKALEVIQPVAEAVLRQLGRLQSKPDQWEVEFGLALGFEGSAVIASTKTEANFKVKFSWKQRQV